MSTSHIAALTFQVGGGLSADDRTYVERSADLELFEALRNRELRYVLNARQMGKTSLRVRMMKRLTNEAGVRCGAVDLSVVGSDGDSPELWFASLVQSLSVSLGIFDAFGAAAWWQSQSAVSPLKKLSNFFEYPVLDLINGDVVIFLDEIDKLLSLPFGDRFFGLIRALHDMRAEQPRLRRLTFALMGVASPSELIRDRKQSPLNIGFPVELNGFSLAEAEPVLSPLMASRCDRPREVLRAVLHWTGGQPFLTQKLCRLVVTQGEHIESGRESDIVAALVHEKIVSDWQGKDDPPHFRTIRDRILLSPTGRTAILLDVVKRILADAVVVADGSVEQVELKLTGLVVDNDGRLQFSNPIYVLIFDSRWVKAIEASIKPFSTAIAGWEASGGKDESWLLRGAVLDEARRWSRGRALPDLDFQFLDASSRAETAAAEGALELEKQGKRRAEKRAAYGNLVAAAVIVAAVCAAFLVLHNSIAEWQAGLRYLERGPYSKEENERLKSALRQATTIDVLAVNANSFASGFRQDIEVFFQNRSNRMRVLVADPETDYYKEMMKMTTKGIEEDPKAIARDEAKLDFSRQVLLAEAVDPVDQVQFRQYDTQFRVEIIVVDSRYCFLTLRLPPDVAQESIRLEFGRPSAGTPLQRTVAQTLESLGLLLSPSTQVNSNVESCERHFEAVWKDSKPFK